MTPPAVVGALMDAWSDLDRACADMTDEEALSTEQGSAHAWTVAHLANQVDSWVNVRFAGAMRNAVVSGDRYRVGATGRAESWDSLREAAESVRATARAYLETLAEEDLDRSIRYPGSLPQLKGRHITMRYTLLRLLAHHYFHIGEIASKRSTAGSTVGDYPGPMLRTAEDGG